MIEIEVIDYRLFHSAAYVTLSSKDIPITITFDLEDLNDYILKYIDHSFEYPTDYLKSLGEDGVNDLLIRFVQYILCEHGECVLDITNINNN